MGTLTFDYKPWDSTKDCLPSEPGSDVGYAVVRSSVDVGDMPYIRQHVPDELIRKAEEGAVGMLAGSLEWLRSRGYSASQVESKVRAYLRDNHDRREQQALRNKQVLQAINEISNPRNRPTGNTVLTV